MAQLGKEPITVGHRIVGTVSVNGGAVRGEGGPVGPKLVVPIALQINPTPVGSMLAVCWIRAWVSLDQNAFLQHAIGLPTSELLVNGFPVRSLPSAPVDHTVELRFPLTLAEVENLEKQRHGTTTNVFTLYLGFDVVVGGLKAHDEIVNGPSKPTQWDMSYGMFAEVSPFWESRVNPIQVQIEQSTWVRDVLPGLGYDRSRLVEMTFPPPLPDHKSAAGQFDKARRALDERRNDDCIRECRGLLNMWEKQLDSTSQRRVAEIVGAERGWTDDDLRRKLLDVLWKEVGDAANAPHHPEGETTEQTFDGRDARLVLLLTALLSEYIGSD